MNAAKQSAETAFDSGAELWILPNSQNSWWQKIDYHSGFLLSACLLFQKKESSTHLANILKETEITRSNFSTNKKSLLLGTENHFFNKWILITPTNTEVAFQEIAEVCDSLKIHSLRFFGTPEPLIHKISARLTASLNRISFVE